MPDALIPVEVAPAWSPYPLNITTGQNGVVWIDITIPKDQEAGLYTGKVIVKNNNTPVEELSLELDVYDAVLPDWPLRTMYYYEYGELARRIGGHGSAIVEVAEKHLWQLFHRHRITSFYSVLTAAEVDPLLGKLHGTVYTAANGYEGPAEGRGDDLLSLGTYGGYGEPDATDLANVEAIADKLAAENLFSTTDVFVYAKDEDCASTWGEEWVDLLQSSENPNVDSIYVGWTCHEEPKNQPVDIVMIGASGYNPNKVIAAQESGKRVWIYNGFIPKSGAMVTDLEAISPRVNGLIQAYYKIERWFQWETTFWYDWNPGGLGAYDPFIESETFHNQYEEYGNGDGMLVYPGKQVDQFTEHSIGMEGVIASIRLKNIRRGIQDAGYYQLAHQVDAEKADELVYQLIHPALSYISQYSPPTWPSSGTEFYALRDSLAQLIINPTGFEDNKPRENLFPESFKLNNVYPNPFNNSTTIRYQLPATGQVELTIYNVLGQPLLTLVDERQAAGFYQMSWDASSYASGIYLLMVKSGRYKDVKKMLLVK
jgi:hypothetical protein